MKDAIRKIAESRNPRISAAQIEELVPYIAAKEFTVSVLDTSALIKLMLALFRTSCLDHGYPAKSVKSLTTKFRDAGRRSAPWKPTSSRVPGRPQDGSDGNRINRWLLPEDHKFYATEIMATLVEVKYILQALSMTGAPDLSSLRLEEAFTPWLLENPLKAGEYLDPVQLIPLDLGAFMSDPRSIQSGHIFPLDRGGRHHPGNTFLMLSRSNQIQGNMTVVELLEFMRKVTDRHEEAQNDGLILETLIRQKTG